MALLFIPAVLADYPDNFDTYANNQTSPGPWKISYDSSAYSDCFSGTSVTTYTVPSTSPNALSFPNTYFFTGHNNATCFGSAHYVRLSLTVNMSQVSGTLSLWYQLTSSAGTNSSTYTVTVSTCGSAFSAFKLDHSTTPYPWKDFLETVSTSVNSACTIYIQLATQAGASASGVAWQIDNFYFTGGNAILSGANFFLVNPQTGSGFDISNYTDSYVVVAFPTGPPVYYYNVTTPNLYVDTAGASLVTVWVGNYYFVHIIPAQSGNNTVYLNPPSSPVLPYTLNVQDLSGAFGTGSMVYIYQGDRVMWSDYLDASSNLAVWMVPGSYKVSLQSSAGTFSTNSNFPSISGAPVYVQILKVSVPNQCGATCTVDYGAGFNAPLDHVVIFFNDTSGLTTHITDTIWISNSSGTFTLYTASWVGTYGYFQDSVSCSSKVCNQANASLMHVTLTYYGGAGSDSVNLPLSGTGLFSQGLNIPPSLLGLDVLFPAGTVSYQAIISYFLILITASAFGVFSARFGVVVVAIMSAALALEGWLPIAPGAITFIVAMAVMSFVASLERS